MRHLLFYSLFAMFLVTVWYNYAPPAQREALPDRVQTAVIYLDAAFTKGVAQTSAWVGHQIQEQIPMAPEDPSAPLVAQTQDGVTLVYEDAPLAEDLPSSETMFLGATLTGSNLSKASFDTALLDGANAQDASFTEASLKNASARLAVFRGAVFHRADLSAATMQRGDFDNTIFVDSQLRDVQFTNASFLRSHIRGGGAIGARFDHADMQHSLIENTDFRRATFLAADLRNTTFAKVQLHGARFDRAKLSGADLSQTSGLTQLGLSGACGDATTRLPQGLSVSVCPPEAIPQPMAGHTPSHSLASIARSADE